MKGISTIIATIIMVVITIGLISVAYLYMSGLITSRTTQNIQLLDAFCGDRINILIKNIGTTDITTTPTFIINGNTITAGITCDASPISAGSSTMCSNSSVMTPGGALIAGPNEIRVIGPSNAVGGTLNC